MSNTISGGYRDNYTLSNQMANSTNSTGSTNSTPQVWNAVFTDKSSSSVDINDFLSLMVAQLQNQDFMNPVDDTQYVTQLAQFATMQQMQEMGAYTKTSYTMSLVGKNVTAAKFTVSGELQKEIGTVQKISLVDNEFAVYVNDVKFTLDQIMEVNEPSSVKTQETTKTDDPTKAEYLLSLIGKEVTVYERDDKGEIIKKLTGVVEKVSTDSKEGYKVYFEGKWYLLDDVLEIGNYAEPNSNDVVFGDVQNSNNNNDNVQNGAVSDSEIDTDVSVDNEVNTDNNIDETEETEDVQEETDDVVEENIPNEDVPADGVTGEVVDGEVDTDATGTPELLELAAMYNRKIWLM